MQEGGLHFREVSNLEIFRDADIDPLVVQSQVETPHCLSDLQISSSLLSDEVK